MTTILIDKNVMLPMRDGVRLATDVYRLDSAPPVPVLLTRTPYNKEQTVVGGGGAAFDIFRAVQAGYAVVIQDTRGRFASEGEFTPHFPEGRDGADTITWAAAEPWSCGVVGGFGGSYLGGTQWLAPASSPQPCGQWHRRSLLRTCTKAWRTRAARTSFTAGAGQP